MNFRQGRLDTLCGLYAITNAITGLAPTRSARWAKEVFAETARAAPSHVWPNCLSEGLEFDELLATARLTCRRLNRVAPHRLSARAFFAKGDPTSVPDMMAERQRLIVWIEALGRSPLAHWSVVRGLAGDVLKMSDSEGLRTFDLRSPRFCGRPARIDWGKSILIQRTT